MKTLVTLPEDPRAEVCYLLHFDAPIGKHNTQHYSGKSKRLPKRLAKHEQNPDVDLLQEFKRRGISFTLVRLWDGYTEREQEIKRSHRPWQYCPLCAEERRQERNRKERERYAAKKAAKAEVK